jgi:HEAT repeat protein
MPVTMEQVREKLEPIEPDFRDAVRLGPAALPFLEQLANGADPQFAPRAVYLASLIGGDRSVRILLKAASSPVTIMRVQAAAAARNLPGGKAENILLKSLKDSDSGVRNVALKSIKAISAMPASIKEQIKTLSWSDPEQFIRDFSTDVLKLSR